jgi:poly(A) polymerase
MEVAHNYPRQEFPITAGDLLERGFTQGPEIGKALARLEQRWVESDYQLGKAELLKLL